MSFWSAYFGGAAASGAYSAAQQGRDPVVGAGEGADRALKTLAPVGFLVLWILGAGWINLQLVEHFDMASKSMTTFALATVLFLLPFVIGRGLWVVSRRDDVEY